MKWSIVSTLKHVIPLIVFIFFFLEMRKQGFVQTYDFKKEWPFMLIVPLVVVFIVVVCQWIPNDVSQAYCDKVWNGITNPYTTQYLPFIQHGKGWSFYGNITCVNKELGGYQPINIFIVSMAAPVIFGIEWFLLWANNKLISLK